MDLTFPFTCAFNSFKSNPLPTIFAFNATLPSCLFCINAPKLNPVEEIVPEYAAGLLSGVFIFTSAVRFPRAVLKVPYATKSFIKPTKFPVKETAPSLEIAGFFTFFNWGTIPIMSL